MSRAVAKISRVKSEPSLVEVPREKLEESSIWIDHDLENAIPYLLARAGVRMGQAFTRELKPFGLSLQEWRVCAALHHKPQQRLAELAEHTAAEPSTLSRMVEGLLQRRLLVRNRSADDARALALSLTPEGDALVQRIIPLAQLYERVALSGIAPAQVELLREMLRRIYANMDTLDPRV
jgi:DNA-binding MarR family transcriptional regulator